jgi:thiamine transporter
MRDEKLRVIVEGALMVALAFVLSFVKVFTAPYGGSITLGSMIPIILFALRHGVGPGIFAGAVHGLLQLIVEPVIVHPVQVLLDYILAFGLLGLAGLFQDKPVLGTVVGVGGRFVSHFISGVIWWGVFAPEGMNVWLYSILYNGAYLLPELIVSVVIVKYALEPFLKQRATTNPM